MLAPVFQAPGRVGGQSVRRTYLGRMIHDEETQAVGIVYDSPAAPPGPPYLAVVFFRGQAIACEPVVSIKEGEVLLQTMMAKLPEMLRQIQEDHGEAELRQSKPSTR